MKIRMKDIPNLKNCLSVSMPYALKKILQKKVLLLCFSLPVFSAGFSQTELLNTIKTNFERYNSHWLQEKIFVHTDKSFYTAGEIVWFKIYNVEGSFHKPVDISKIAYVEILNKDLKPVLQAKISLKDGIGNGSLLLPLSFNSGPYKIRAYTNWMKNFSPDYYFEKDFTVVNTLKKLSSAVPDGAQKYDIRFFPEGGNLVDGIESKVAFRVTDEHGKGVDCTGSVVDQHNNSIANFSSQQFGIGHFLFTPSIGSNYKAVIKLNGNNAVIADMPEVFDHGYTLRLEDRDSSHVSVVIRKKGDSENEPVYLLVHTRQQIKSAEMLFLQNGNAGFIINKNDLGDGVSHFTLFNSHKQPLCERLYFKRPAAQLVISANADQDEYTLRKKVYVNILAHDEKNSPVNADMSMAVFLEDSLQSVNGEDDIFSYLWLSSDLKGHIESPRYYFSKSSAQTDEALDNLMLTQGWRRFKWKDVMNQQPASFEFLPEYEGHIITGKITDKKSGLPVENITTYLTVPGEQFQLGGSVSNKMGKIQFDIKNFYSAAEVIVQSDNQKDSSCRIDIYTPFSDKFSDSKFPAFQISKNNEDVLVSHSISTQAQNAYRSDNLQKFLAPPGTLDTTAFYGQPDTRYFLDDYTRFTTMEEVMREYVANILVKKQKGKFHINMMDNPWHNFFKDDPLVLLDGLPVFDITKMIEFDPLKVKKVELVNRQYFLGPINADGIISYTTYKGDLAGFQLDPNAVILEYDGLQLQREFYSPVYDTPKETASRMPDLRNVLYWSPDVKTNQDGKKQIKFFTSDMPGKYILCIQGTTSDGKCGSQIVKFDGTK